MPMPPFDTLMPRYAAAARWLTPPLPLMPPLLPLFSLFQIIAFSLFTGH
jgi:hypothetical protein